MALCSPALCHLRPLRHSQFQSSHDPEGSARTADVKYVGGARSPFFWIAEREWARKQRAR